jgi:hypothetical protein
MCTGVTGGTGGTTTTVRFGVAGGYMCNAPYYTQHMTRPNPTTDMERVEFRLSNAAIEELDRIAHELSEPGPENTVRRSDVLREAAANFIDEFDAQEDTLAVGKVDDGDRGEA